LEDIENFWEELKFEVGTIGQNYGDDKEKKTLIGAGNRKGRLLFIGDDPDLYQNEDLRVLPGTSGEFLIKLCDIEEITPEDYYITTLSKKNCKYCDLMEEDRKALKELLHMQIALINPEIIVALGLETAETLLNKEIKIQDERGKVINWIGSIKVIPTYDVNFVKKSRKESGKKSKVALDFWNDLKLAKEELLK
jgi:uracil-DNA glycosylase family 4